MRRLRKARGLRLLDVARVTGINIATVSLIERDGLKDVKLDAHLRPIARALSTTVTSLLPECDRRKPRMP